MEAAIGCVQLSKVNLMIEQRKKNANIFSALQRAAKAVARQLSPSLSLPCTLCPL
jgi:dTDP-4-amino-4,6-dideoxygalactose transaminase